MRLRWTLLVEREHEGGGRAGDVRRHELEVTCPPGTPLHDVLGLVPDLLPADLAEVSVNVSGRALGLRHPAGLAPLLDGAALRVSSCRPADHRTSSGFPPPRAAASGPTDPDDTLRRRPRGGVPLLELVVLAGPDAGRSHRLAGGRLSLGRSAGCDVTLADPRVSRVHCHLTLGPDGLTLHDPGSTNGTTSPGGAGASRLGLGDRCRTGASVLALRRTPTEPEPATGTGTAADGTVVLHRSPRLRRPEHAPTLVLPTPARPGRSGPFPVLAVVLPAVAAVALAAWTGSPVYLLMAGVGPLMVAGSWWSGRREARRDGRLGRREHARACTELREQAHQEAVGLAAVRSEALPDAATLLRRGTTTSPRLWERAPRDADALRLRLGLAVDDDTRTTSPVLLPRVGLRDHEDHVELVATDADLVACDLRDGALGVVEDGDGAGVARFVVGQLAALLSPVDLQVVTVVSGPARGRWGWVRLLPHAAEDSLLGPAAGPHGRAAAQTARDVGALLVRRAATTTDVSGPRSPLLVVLDDPDGEVDPGDLGWLPAAHELDVHVVAVADRAAALPRGCRLLVHPSSPDGVEMTVVRLEDAEQAHFVADRVGGWWSERLSRAMAPLRPATVTDGAGPPDRVRLADLLDLSPEAVLHRWSQPAPGLGVPLGTGADGVVSVDLTGHGPHALVAGTTGAGKSELLRSWLLALAAVHPPDRVAFLLVDYKGGSSFEDLLPLPHTMGLLTDLDGGTTARVLHALRAEVRRRERVLAGAGARDLTAFLAAGGTGMPRLVVVVDEFRVLAEEAPDVLSAFLRLATTGRSLGMHLVLATQRPAGVVSADIRANTGLRIALRVQDAEESRDVLDRPDAASLPPDRPGRAVLVGAGLDATVQTAFCGVVPTPRTTVRVAGETTGRRRPPAGPTVPGRHAPAAGTDVPSPAQQAVTDVVAAARRAGLGRVEPPWPAPLPERLLHVPARPAPRAGSDPAAPADTGTPGAGSGRFVLGATDLPWVPGRGTLVWAPQRHGSAVVLGGPRSGRSGTLAAAARAAAAQGVPVVRLTGGEQDADHLVETLDALARHRRPDGDVAPDVLLLVDDVDDLLDPAADPTAADLLTRLLRDGHRHGVGVMVAGGRALAVSRVTAGAGARLVHRLGDPSDAVLVGLPAAVRAGSPAPGRCLVLGLDTGDEPTSDGSPRAVEAQVLLCPGPEAPGGAGPGAGAAAGVGVRPPTDVPLPGWLPRPLGLGTTPACPPTAAPTGSRSTADAPPTGWTAPDAQPWSWDLDQPLVVVVGPPGSGRTSALRAVAARAATTGRRSWTLPPHGSLDDPGDARRPKEGAEGGPPADVLLVDDVEQQDESALVAVEAWLTRRTGPLADRLAADATVVLGGATGYFADGFSGLPALARQAGYGVVLHASRTDARDVLGARGPVVQRTLVPGRGLLVVRGRTSRVQLATAED